MIRRVSCTLAVVASSFTVAQHAPEDHLEHAIEVEGLTDSPIARYVNVVAGNNKKPNSRAFHETSPGVGVAKLRSDELRALWKADPTTAPDILPPMRLATDQAIPIIGVPILETQGITGKGVYVGIVDSGFDVAHPALRDISGKSRFAWLLDYTRRVRGKHVDLETEYGIFNCLAKQQDGTASDNAACITGDSRCTTDLPCGVTDGAIFSGDDLDALIQAGPTSAETLPTDEEGHGTHALAIAAGSHLPTSAFRGVATDAKLIGVKSDGDGYTINAGSVIQGIQFIFDRAKDANVPASINLSLSSDFAVRDGTDPLGPAVAALARGPGRVIVVASGNSGDPNLGIHQAASVGANEHVRVELHAFDAIPTSHVEIIVSPHPGSDLRIGVDSPNGTFVVPIERGKTRSATIGDGIANVVFNPADFQGRLPAASTSAIVTLDAVLTGKEDDYALALEGTGTADMWINGGQFLHGVREATVGSPAMHPDMIAVGASVSRAGYRSMAGEDLVIRAQVYDQSGLIPLDGVGSLPSPGQIAAFSGAGPGPMGVIKPDLVAPGVAIVSAASSSRDPRSILLGSSHCPARADGTPPTDDRCLFVDADHAAATGTSFAAPFVTGAAAVLLQVDPTLTQEEMRTALQAGVHPHRSVPLFAENASVGELDVPGAVDVAKRIRNPIRVLPAFERSWITANSHYVPADGSRPLEVLVHLRSATGEPADGFDVNRFGVTVLSGDMQITPSRIERVAPGMWGASFDLGRHGDSFSVTISAAFDGSAIAAPLVIPLALDPWQARYPSSASGAKCSSMPFSRMPKGETPWSLSFMLFVGFALLARKLAKR